MVIMGPPLSNTVACHPQTPGERSHPSEDLQGIVDLQGQGLGLVLHRRLNKSGLVQIHRSIEDEEHNGIQ